MKLSVLCACAAGAILLPLTASALPGAMPHAVPHEAPIARPMPEPEVRNSEGRGDERAASGTEARKDDKENKEDFEHPDAPEQHERSTTSDNSGSLFPTLAVMAGILGIGFLMKLVEWRIRAWRAARDSAEK